MKYFFYYLIIMNIISFIVMFIDKLKAQKHRWRISERSLFIYALLFGSVGIWLGMYSFRHKTKHKKFVIGIPCIVIVQILILYLRYLWI